MIVKTEFNRVKEIEIVKFNEQNEEMGRAYLVIHIRPNNEKMALIEDVFTEEKYRRQGVGTILVEEAIRTAKNANCYKICLSCADHNVHFYEKLGFKVYQNAMRINLNG
jgi:GNAT superfamily N-acetyltransferase